MKASLIMTLAEDKVVNALPTRAHKHLVGHNY